MFKVKRDIVLLCILIASVLASCKKGFEGTELGNVAPETYLVTDTIIRFGPDRLESEVVLKWWSDDPDGFVSGYEFTFDAEITEATIWTYTERQDSTFAPGVHATGIVLMPLTKSECRRLGVAVRWMSGIRSTICCMVALISVRARLAPRQ